MARLAAARATGRLGRRSILRRVGEWPAHSPAAANAWLLLVTSKPPTWRDLMLAWPQEPPTLGTPHPGFFYPDPLGFWSEVRHWVATLLHRADPTIALSDALSLAALIHIGDDPSRVALARGLLRPVVTLFLDDAARQVSGAEPANPVRIPDPHRPGTTYDGWWAPTDEGHIVGKAPQHPASHHFYRRADMDLFLRGIPLDRAPALRPV